MAQGAMAEAALSQAARNPDGPATLAPDPFNVGPAMTSVMTSLAARPEKLFQAQADLFGRYMDLWSSTARQAAGETPDPAPADKRFKDPAWSENPMFDMMRRSYLLTSDWMNGLVAGVEDVRSGGETPRPVLHPPADRRLLAVELSGLQPGGAEGPGRDQRRIPGQGNAELRRRPGTGRRIAAHQPGRLRQVRRGRERRDGAGPGRLARRTVRTDPVRAGRRDPA